MFTSKQKQLETPTKAASKTTKTSTNQFVKAGLKKAFTTTALGNGAVKMTSSTNDFVDQFGKITNYKAPRAYNDVAKDMQLLWSQDPAKALKLAFFIRTITRVTNLPDGKRTATTQRGQGMRNEGIYRLMWVQINHPDAFWANIPLYISIASWKDIITMLSLDLQYNGYDGRTLDWDKFGQLIAAGLENPASSNLLKKFLPQIKAKSQAKSLEAQADNMVAKFICRTIIGETKGEHGQTYKQYRKLKTSGTAHEWQKLISKKKLVDIDFNTIHGRALSQLVSGKFLKNNNLETKYEKWLEAKPVAKYTGFVYELFEPLGTSTRQSTGSLKKYQIDTINKQFLGLVETGKKGMKEGDGGLIVVLDSSGSMTSLVSGTKSSAYSVGKSMALYFSYLLKGAFENHFLEFSDKTIMKTWKGKTPVDKMVNETSSIVAGTNFRSVGTHFVNMLQAGVPLSDFPTGILCVSDGCFNNSGSNKSETKLLKADLLKGGFPKYYVDNFKIVLWDMPNSYYGKSQTAFEDFADAPNLFHMSGLDGSAIAFLTGVEGQKATPKTSEELFDAAMDQEVLNMITV